ncbi:MAG: NYN domain-containing protein [Actinobacteria bacterium]|nr:NYN domain-containing protein [Actinomycetota bacterium]
MIKKFLKGRVAVFIDASNIYFSQKTLGWKIDFKKLLNYFKSECNLVRISFYSSINPENKKERKFHDFLEIIGYIVKHKKIKFVKNFEELKFGGHHKGNIDVDLTIDAVHLKNSYDSFVLFSGDSDFMSLIKFLKSFNKFCIVISTKDHISIELIKEAKFIDFKKLRDKIELK